MRRGRRPLAAGGVVVLRVCVVAVAGVQVVYLVIQQVSKSVSQSISRAIQ